MAATTLTVRDLRRQWTPHKARLSAAQSDHPTAVRFHRACSWLDQVESLDSEQQSDIVLIQQWIALNALYGQWDGDAREPAADRQRWKEFLTQILAIDSSQHIQSVLVEHKRLVLAILGNAYLNRYFWAEPTEQSKGRCERGEIQAHSWYVEKRWLVITEQVLERVYLLRCQVIHGAATCGSQLNREALKHCTTMLRWLLPAILRVWIDHGSDCDWGPMCYPPMGGRDNGRFQRRSR